MRWIPSRAAVQALGGLAFAAGLALLLGTPHLGVIGAAGALLVIGLVYAAIDLRRSLSAWQRAPVTVQRQMPQALALGVTKVLSLSIANPGRTPWRVQVFDEPDERLRVDDDLPQTVDLPAGQRVEVRYRATPRERGLVKFGGTQLRLRSLGGCFELLHLAGAPQQLHVYPNFAAVARYAWLAGDRRLSQIGVKTYQKRGSGTDFKQLADYQRGDAIRHIDWKATLRHNRPIVRQFQDERDQCVLFLLDCGRRMRADEGNASVDGSHFDQALNALMVLSYVALKEGDEVGAMTFGHEAGQPRHFAPRKGTAALNALMARLYDIQPGTTHSDYLLAAQELLRVQRKRALIVMLTNFRDEDAAELQPALKLLRSRHLVMVASLRERVLREIAEQPLQRASHAVEAAGAHLFEQSRRDAFRRTVPRDGLSVDVEPAELPVALVNRYHAVKRSGML